MENTVNLSNYASYAIGVGTSTEDWTPALQKANDDIVASGRCQVIIIPQNIQIRQTFYWDVRIVSLLGYGATINVDINDSAAYAIRTRAYASQAGDVGTGAGTVASLGEPSQATQFMEGIKLVGKAIPTCKGIYWTGDEGSLGAAHISLNRVGISGFSLAEDYSVGGYMIGHNNCDIHANTQAIQCLNHLNVGERVAYTNCNIFNNDCGIYLDNPDADFYFNGCSVDFCRSYSVQVQNGKTYFDTCHIENLLADYAAGRPPYVIGYGDGATINFCNCYISFSIPEMGTLDYVFMNNATGKGGLLVDGCTLFGCLTTTGYLAVGHGKTVIKNTKGVNIMQNSMITHLDNNLLCDGVFEYGNGSIIDEIYISEDSAPVQPYSRDGQSISLSISTEFAREYSHSLKVTRKSTGVGAFRVAVPMDDGAIPAAEFFYKKMAGELHGDIIISYGFQKKDGRGNIVRQTTEGSQTITFTYDNFDWRRWGTGVDVPRKPTWANEFYLSVNINGLSDGGMQKGFFIDSMCITQM